MRNILSMQTSTGYAKFLCMFVCCWATGLHFTICYDFFTKVPREKPIDDSFYSDVNFEKFDIEDTDGDMVSDNDDHCPETPQGVKVDEFSL